MTSDTTTTVPADLISVEEACDIIRCRRAGKRVHRSTVYRMLKNGKLRGWTFGDGKAVLLSRAELAESMKLRPYVPAKRRKNDWKPRCMRKQPTKADVRWVGKVLEEAGVHV